MSTKSFERTYEIDTEGAPFAPLTPAQRAGLTHRLRNDAADEGHELGETVVVSRRGTIGGVFSVLVRADVVGATEEEADQ